MAKKAEGRNTWNKQVPIGANVSLVKMDTEGTDAHGRQTQLVRDESPNRIDEISDDLIYLGWAEYGSDEAEPVWKIKRITVSGTIVRQEFADGEQYYRHIWNDRLTLSYS